MGISNQSGITLFDNGLPSGGSTGQVATKASDEDFDVVWANLPTIAIGENFVIEQPISSDVYTIILKARFSGTITETTTICVSGTCTATFSINGTPLGGTANSVSSSEQSQTHSSANTFVAGDDIAVTISSVSACKRLAASIAITRSL